MWISSDIFIQRPDNDQNITEVNANIIPMPGILWKSDRFRDITEQEITNNISIRIYLTKFDFKHIISQYFIFIQPTIICN